MRGKEFSRDRNSVNNATCFMRKEPTYISFDKSKSPSLMSGGGGGEEFSPIAFRR